MSASVTRGVPGVSPARACAYAVVRRVFEQGAYADRAFHAQARRLDDRDRSFAMALAYGTVQRRATLDHVAAALLDRPPERLDAPVLAVLRLGLMQVLLLDGVAAHAAVHESVELIKRDARGASGLVNAVLRRATREGPAILAALDDSTPDRAAILHSVPAWLAQLWWRELGPDQARAQLACVNRPAESALRVNPLVATRAEVVSALGARAAAGDGPTPIVAGGSPAIVLDGPFDAYASKLWERGAIMPQSRGSMAVADLLAPAGGDRVLDLCAAPGAKTTQLAALMGDRGSLLAVERHAGRAQALRRTLGRMHVACATVQEGDAAVGGFPACDRVLVDPPCSGLGTLQSRPDLRWRTSPGRIAELAPQQAAILRAGAAATRPGGRLVYSVCTISRTESEQVVEGFLAAHEEFELEDAAGRGDGPYLRTSPATDGTDGFFIAALRRR
ncbi:MAG: 16S rRNA (cytosine(967)-C(5))-methyltransferase RsmB [Solirubrobacteraceae bacterium]|jgi:16S rRNA (cytosine967-C5)-methyltransferase